MLAQGGRGDTRRLKSWRCRGTEGYTDISTTPGQYWSNNLGFLPLSSCSCTLCYMKILNLPAFCVSRHSQPSVCVAQLSSTFTPCFLAALLNSPWGRISAALPPLRLRWIIKSYSATQPPLWIREQTARLYSVCITRYFYAIFYDSFDICLERLVRKSGKSYKRGGEKVAQNENCQEFGSGIQKISRNFKLSIEFFNTEILFELKILEIQDSISRFKNHFY